MGAPVLLLLLACPKPTPPVPAPAVEAPVEAPADPAAAYAAAVQDASEALPDEIFEGLTTIRQDNPALLWQEGAPTPRVRLVTWTSWTGYDDRIGASMVLSREVWVTVAPELQSRCRSWALPGESLELRLEQLLGLPPENGKDRFVELYARPEDLFRPCADPEITDHRCEIALPAEHQPAPPSWYADWFGGLMRSSYGEGGYPWTRLGYTYDWGGEPGADVGLSELVIQSGAEVVVAGVTPTAAYCAPAR